MMWWWWCHHKILKNEDGSKKEGEKDDGTINLVVDVQGREESNGTLFVEIGGGESEVTQNQSTRGK
jgi:hypothetical protein